MNIVNVGYDSTKYYGLADRAAGQVTHYFAQGFSGVRVPGCDGGALGLGHPRRQLLGDGVV